MFVIGLSQVLTAPAVPERTVLAMTRIRVCLIALLALVALAACGGDPATAPAEGGVSATPSTPAHDVDDAPPPTLPDGEYTRPDGSVYCVRNGLIISAHCPVASELVLTCPSSAVRGTRVACTVHATENRPFRIDSAVAFPAAGAPIRIRGTPAMFAVDAMDTVSGRLIVSTVLKVWGEPLGTSFRRTGVTSGVSLRLQIVEPPNGGRR